MQQGIQKKSKNLSLSRNAYNINRHVYMLLLGCFSRFEPLGCCSRWLNLGCFSRFEPCCFSRWFKHIRKWKKDGRQSRSRPKDQYGYSRIGSDVVRFLDKAGQMRLFQPVAVSAGGCCSRWLLQPVAVPACDSNIWALAIRPVEISPQRPILQLNVTFRLAKCLLNVWTFKGIFLPFFF